MTINYLDSKRISALSSDTKPTNVEANSILVQKDVGSRYWFNGTAWIPIVGTRGLFMANATIDYITVATTGNATDFGDPSVTRYVSAGGNSDTRGVFCR